METIYCVTGAAGHLGKHIADKLVQQGKKVRIFVLPGESSRWTVGAEVVIGDITDIKTIEPLFIKSPDQEICVIHCAGIVSITEKYDAKVYAVNVEGTKNIVDLCLINSVKKFVYISSVHAAYCQKGINNEQDLIFDVKKVSGNYAKSKCIATEYVLSACKKGLNGVMLLPSGIIGGGQQRRDHLTEMFKLFCEGKLKAAIKGGYDFVDVRDVADVAITAAENENAKGLYLVSAGRFMLKELLGYAAEHLNVKKTKLYLSAKFVALFAPFCEAYYALKKKTPLFTKCSLQVISSGITYSTEKAKQELAFNPRPMQETVEYAIDYLIKSGVAVKRKIKPKNNKKHAE